MAVENARIAPFINKEFTVTSAQPYRQDGVTLHGGLDISTGSNDPVYSMVNGRVLYSQWNTGGYGNCIITQDMTTGDSFLYAHLRDLPLKRVGDSVVVGEQLGIEGTTGTSTGIHLHVEWQQLNPGNAWDWNIPYIDRPHVADFMGITNVAGTRAIYNGEPPVPPTPGSRRKTHFKWVLYANKLRDKRNVKFM